MKQNINIETKILQRNILGKVFQEGHPPKGLSFSDEVNLKVRKCARTGQTTIRIFKNAFSKLTSNCSTCSSW